MQTRHYWIYGGLALLSLALTALATQLGAGAVPIPATWAWVIPIASPVIVGATMLLPKLGDVAKAPDGGGG